MTHSSGLHALLLLSDSALPLGSFAFSSGLESYLAHTKDNANLFHQLPNIDGTTKLASFERFLSHSVANVSSTALPYVLAGYHSPAEVENLDNDFDASTACTVARRASVTQGRALLTIWERALSYSILTIPACEDAAQHLTAFAAMLKTSKPDTFGLQLNGHFPPLFGIACCALGLGAQETAYVFLLNHAKAVLSAAVRASVMGPYQSHAILASAKLQGWIRQCVDRDCEDGKGKGKGPESAAVTVPTMDLWMGRHELLYSRIFNS